MLTPPCCFLARHNPSMNTRMPHLTLTEPTTHRCEYSLTYSPTFPLAHSVTQSLTVSHTHSISHSLSHSLAEEPYSLWPSASLQNNKGELLGV